MNTRSTAGIDTNSETSQTDVAESLCSTCCFCCSGAFFYRTVVTEEEVSCLTSLSVPAKPYRHSKFSIMHPCSALSECKCSIYSQRPQDCRDWSCKLLIATESGTIPFSSAKAIIANGKSKISSLTTRINSFLPPERSGTTNFYLLLHKLTDYVEESIMNGRPEGVGRKALQLIGATRDYLVLINEHFRSPSLLGRINTLIDSVGTAKPGKS